MKTQKSATFRKSALFSSVAMLLVATVALGTATYAWFSQNTTATASGINVSSTSAEGLYISETDSNYSGSVTWTDTAVFAPASSAFANLTAPVFYSTTTENADGTADVAAGAAAVNATDSGTNYYLAKDLYVKAANDTTKNLKVAVTVAGTASNYARVAIVDVDTADTGMKGIVSGEAETYKAIASATASSITYSEDMNATTSITDALVTGMGTTPHHYKVYVWFEGCDSQCTTSTSGKGLDVSLQFTLAE